MSKGLRFTAALLAVAAISLPLAALGAGRVSLDNYHSYEEVLALLRNMQAAHPDLATLLSAGKSYQGRELWVVQVTNRKVGAPEEKPAVFIAGSLRGDEPVGTAVSWAVIDHLLRGYTSD
ncbi:MAG: M14 family zinc carboxypeptidase, partial [Candidatus Oleimicrobiaceae bacterium]